MCACDIVGCVTLSLGAVVATHEMHPAELPHLAEQAKPLSDFRGCVTLSLGAVVATHDIYEHPAEQANLSAILGVALPSH